MNIENMSLEQIQEAFEEAWREIRSGKLSNKERLAKREVARRLGVEKKKRLKKRL